MNGKNCKISFKNKDIDDDDYVEFLKCDEKNNIDTLRNLDTSDILYPHLNDINFNEKIFTKKEFNDNKYAEKKDEDYKEDKLIKISKKYCNNKDFELDPHQLFVKNFLSMNTPYNSLLLYHGLGTGKTCSAITICEEMRKYYDMMGLKKKIIVICSKQLQENFKNQIFNPDKLPEKPINGYWNLKTCVGSKLLKEINPTHIKNLSRKKVIRYINRIIKTGYKFYGYIEFKNRMHEVIFGGTKGGRKVLNTDSQEIIDEKIKYNIKRKYSNCTLVIDEIHNLRVENEKTKIELKLKYKGDDKKIKKQEKIDKESAEYIKRLVTYSTNLKLLLLSATPMFNKSKEIIWLLNILNLNDGRYPLKYSDIFNNDGDIHETGKQLLLHKSRGYISYIRGNNPFSFPHKVFPNLANNKNSLFYKIKNGWKYPTQQMNNKDIIFNKGDFTLKDTYDLILLKLPEYQLKVYNSYIDYLFEKKGEKFLKINPDIQMLDGTKQILNICYPNDGDGFGYGLEGLNSVMVEKMVNNKKKYTYRDGVDKVFKYENIGKYSVKIKSILDTIQKSEGIILIYSQYISSGCVPMALALEELGFETYSSEDPFIPNRNLLNNSKNPSKNKWFKFTKKQTSPKYIMITGKSSLTGSVKRLMNVVSDNKNKNGDMIKVVIISAKGSEGLDFKNIRQIHIMDPWYNFNRIEQIIGRGVRKLSHCGLPYKKRNVEIFLYGTLLEDENKEACDLYLYRLAKKKANQIGIINRLLKQNAVDCLLNKNANFHKESKISLTLSSNYYSDERNNIIYNIKNEDGDGECDYMECDYKCYPTPKENIKQLIKNETYNLTHINNNKDIIIKKIKNLFREKYIYNKKNLFMLISPYNKFSKYEIDNALNYLINTKGIIFDIIDTEGNLINIGDKYLFQPIHIKNKNTAYYNRVHRLLNNKRHISISLKNTQVNPIRKDKQKDLYKTKKIESLDEEDSVESYKIYNKLITYINILSSPQKKNTNSWIEISSRTIENMIKYDKDFGNDKEKFKSILIRLAIQHEILLLTINEKIKLINTYENYKPDDINDIVWEKLKLAIEYFLNERLVQINDYKYCVLNTNSKKLKNIYDDKKKKYMDVNFLHNLIFLKKEENNWVKKNKDKELEKQFFLEYTNKFLKERKINIKLSNLSTIFGYMRTSSSTDEYEFYYSSKKLPKIYNARNKVLKPLLITTFKKVKNKYSYIKDSRKVRFNGKDIVYSADEIFNELELTLRFYNYIKKDEKIWFLNPYDDYILRKDFSVN